jgi:hypothetical protein
MTGHNPEFHNAENESSLELNKETLQDLDLEEGFGADLKGGGIATAASCAVMTGAGGSGNTTTVTYTCATAIVYPVRTRSI